MDQGVCVGMHKKCGLEEERVHERHESGRKRGCQRH